MIERRKLWILDLYILVLSALLLLSPWLFSFRYELAREESWAAGAVLVIVSTAALFAFQQWKEWLIFLVGIWLLSAPWFMAFPHTAAMKIHIGIGLIVAYLAGLCLLLHNYIATSTPR